MKFYDVMTKNEDAIFISFTDRFEAEEWLNKQPDRFDKDNSIRYGMHIVENTIFTLSEIGKKAIQLNTLDEWVEEDGECLWWMFPIMEAPYVGCPLSCDFPNYVTHFTRIIEPNEPIE